MEYFLSVVRDNYANFSGRARRAEYWYFALFYTIIYVLLYLVGRLVGHDAGGQLLAGLFSLALLLPSIGVAIRRLHDTNRSGWFLFLLLIPLIGAIILLVFYCQDSDVSDNQYGPNPKLAVVAAA